MEDSEKKYTVDKNEKATPFGSGWLFFHRRLMGKFSNLAIWIMVGLGFALIVTVIVLLLTGAIGDRSAVESAVSSL